MQTPKWLIVLCAIALIGFGFYAGINVNAIVKLTSHDDSVVDEYYTTIVEIRKDIRDLYQLELNHLEQHHPNQHHKPLH